MGGTADVRGEDEAQAAALFFRSLDGGCGPARALGDGRVIELGIKVLIFFDEQEERTRSDLCHERADLFGGDAGGRLENRAKGGLGRGEASASAHSQRAVSRAGKGADDLLGNLEGDEPRILIFVNVEDDRAGDGVENVAGGEM